MSPILLYLECNCPPFSHTKISYLERAQTVLVHDIRLSDRIGMRNASTNRNQTTQQAASERNIVLLANTTTVTKPEFPQQKQKLLYIKLQFSYTRAGTHDSGINVWEKRPFPLQGLGRRSVLSDLP